jgi:hypothetical protein
VTAVGVLQRQDHGEFVVVVFVFVVVFATASHGHAHRREQQVPGHALGESFVHRLLRVIESAVHGGGQPYVGKDQAGPPDRLTTTVVVLIDVLDVISILLLCGHSTGGQFHQVQRRRKVQVFVVISALRRRDGG